MGSTMFCEILVYFFVVENDFEFIPVDVIHSEFSTMRNIGLLYK